MECLEMSYTYYYTKLCYNDNMKCLNQKLYGMTLKVETQEGNGWSRDVIATMPSMDTVTGG